MTLAATRPIAHRDLEHGESQAGQRAIMTAPAPALVRVGVPLPGGRLVEIARDANLPVLFSANAFMRRTANGEVSSVRLADRAHFGGLNAALDSAGFVAAVKYRGFPWSIDHYLKLAQSYDWAWYATMDFCVEAEVAGDKTEVMFRLAETVRMFSELRNHALDRGMAAPMPVLQGWTPAQYVWCANAYPLLEWPDMIGLGSMCRRHLHGDVGIFAVIDALDRILPPHVKFHLFGVKGKALEHLGQHPRVISVDSMAWEAAARRDHPTGRNMDLRGEYMLAWAEKNKAAAAGVQVGRTPSLLPVEPERVNPRIEHWLDLVTSNEITGPDAHWAALRNFDQLDDHPGGEDEDEDEREDEGCRMGMA